MRYLCIVGSEICVLGTADAKNVDKFCPLGYPIADERDVVCVDHVNLM